MNTEISLITSHDDIALLVEAAKERYDYLLGKVSKMPKIKALELIAQSYSGYEATDAYTVKANLEAAYNDYFAQLVIRGEEIAQAELHVTTDETTDNAKTKEEVIAALLVDLAAEGTTKNAKKNIRAKLRRLGYYRSMFADAQAADVAEGSTPQELPEAEDADEAAYQEAKAAQEYENDR